MQSVIFTISFSNVDIDDLQNSVAVFLFDNTAPTSGLVVTVSNAQLLSDNPASTPSEIQIVEIVSSSVVIKVTHETADLEFLTLIFDKLVLFTRDNIAPMENNYKPLHNFYNGVGNIENDINYTSPFNTTRLAFNYNRILDMQLQFSYDASVNMIFADDVNPVRLINSRWILSENGNEAALADRNQVKDTNTYSNQNFHRTELIPSYNSIPNLTFDGTFLGGKLEGGGYRYFFRYLTADGAETDICEESRLVEVHKGDNPTNAVGASPDEDTGLSVMFTLKNLDDSFYGIRAYYTISQGDFGAATRAFKIERPFVIEAGVCKIIHTGYEITTGTDKDGLVIAYSDISKAKTLTSANNRLLIGNIEIEDLYNENDAVRAASCTIEEDTFEIKYSAAIDGAINENYSNNKFTYNKLGYWKGETYELGIVLVNGNGQSVVYSLHGIDNINGDGVYSDDLLGNTNPGFFENGENSLGVYRTEDTLDNFWTLDSGTGVITFKGTNLKVNINPILDNAEGYEGFYFVRRKRKKDKIAQGIITPTAATPTISSAFPDTAAGSAGNWLGVGVTMEDFLENVTMVPAPNCLMPFGSESLRENQYTDAASPEKGQHVDFVLKAPILDYNKLRSWAFYSPDTDCAPVRAATEFDGSKMGISVSSNKIPTTYHYVSEESSVVRNQPYYISLSESYDNSLDYTWDHSMEGFYTETGSMAVASKSFSGKMDRNLYIWQNEIVNKQPDYTYWIDHTDGTDNIFGDGTVADFTPAVIGVPSEDRTAEETGKLPSIDSWMKEGQTPGNAVNYGRYIGIRIPGYTNGFEDLNMNTTYQDAELGDNKYANRAYQFSLASTGSSNILSDDPTYSYAYLANIYKSTSAKPVTGASWEAKYLSDESTEYFSISRRYSLKEFEEVVGDAWVDLYGGDCYLGLQWKQVWSPLGIQGLPQVTDMDPYREDRRALGLLSYGFAMPVPVQSNYNFNIRSKSIVNTVEYKATTKKRSFLPLKKDIRGDKIVETGEYNFGYDQDYPIDARYYRLNSFTPYVKISFPNRVYASNPGIENEFWNGFTVFRGLNFKDYNTEYGYISKIITLNNFTYFVFHHGIAQIGVNERSMVSTDTGGIFTDSIDVLSVKSNVVSDKYGSQHLHSVVGSVSYIYGVDAINKKIWRSNQKGSVLVSDFKVQKLLTEIIDEMQEEAKETGRLFDIYANHDIIKNDIIFTFHVMNATGAPLRSRTLVFNETLGVWVAETDDTLNYLFKCNEDRYTFNTAIDRDTIYKYYRSETNERKSYYNKFYGTIYDAHVGYNVIDNPTVAKVFENLYLVGNQSMPYKVIYGIENVNGDKYQILIPYTNVSYEFPDLTLVGLVGNDYFEVYNATGTPIKWNGERLGNGDFITVVNESGGKEYFVCMGYEDNGVDPHILYIDKQLTSAFITQTLILGYPNPIRTSTAAHEDTYTKVVCRTLGKDTPKIYTPRGKWAKICLTYEGMSPMFLDRALTSYSVSYS